MRKPIVKYLPTRCGRLLAEMNRFTNRGLRSLLCLALLALTLSPTSEAGVVETWEFSPYKVQLWLAIESAPDLPEAIQKEILATLLDRTEVVFGGTWDLRVTAPPAPFATEAIYRPDQIPVADLVERARLGKLAAPKKEDGATGSTTSAAGASGSSTPAPTTPANSATSSGDGSQPSASATEANASTVAATTTGANEKSETTVSAANGAVGDGSAAASGEKTPSPEGLVTAQLRAVFAGEKLIVLSITSRSGQWLVRARELDCRSRQWGSLIEVPVADAALLAAEAAAAAHATFTPVARTESVQDNKTAILRMRAAGLARNNDCPVLVGPNTVIQPYLRYNDRYGEPKQGGIQTLPWTTLVVTKLEGTGVHCDIYSGGRVALAGRSNARTERFALVSRTAYPSTSLQLRTLDKVPQPLSGYDIYAKDPRNEDTVLLGRTDWRGAMEIKPAEFPVRLVYVKNGGSLLARLPIAPGTQRSLQVDLQSDDKRLQAEGFLLGVQATLTDVVAQRELLVKRLRNRLIEGKFDEAEKMLAEFKTLPTRDDIQKLLDQNQPRITSPHPKVQAKIDKQFEDSRKLLFKFVEPSIAAKLEKEIADGKVQSARGAAIEAGGAPPPVAAPPAAPASPPAAATPPAGGAAPTPGAAPAPGGAPVPGAAPTPGAAPVPGGAPAPGAGPGNFTPIRPGTAPGPPMPK